MWAKNFSYNKITMIQTPDLFLYTLERPDDFLALRYMQQKVCQAKLCHKKLKATCCPYKKNWHKWHTFSRIFNDSIFCRTRIVCYTNTSKSVCVTKWAIIQGAYSKICIHICVIWLHIMSNKKTTTINPRMWRLRDGTTCYLHHTTQ